MQSVRWGGTWPAGVPRRWTGHSSALCSTAPHDAPDPMPSPSPHCHCWGQGCSFLTFHEPHCMSGEEDDESHGAWTEAILWLALKWSLMIHADVIPEAFRSTQTRWPAESNGAAVLHRNIRWRRNYLSNIVVSSTAIRKRTQPAVNYVLTREEKKDLVHNPWNGEHLKEAGTRKPQRELAEGGNPHAL